MEVQKELRDKLRRFLRFLECSHYHFNSSQPEQNQNCKRAFPLHDCMRKIRYFRNMIQKVVNTAMQTKLTEDALF